MNHVKLLDCTLRDGAYIVDGKFGSKTISGIIKRLQDANVDIIECGWLKNTPHKKGTTYFHIPDDIKSYFKQQDKRLSIYVAMIDFNRYDISQLPDCDGQTISAIRIVFPQDKVKEGLALVEPIRQKGYKVFLQAANTLGYSDYELLKLADEVNKLEPDTLSIVDTYGAMYAADLRRIVLLLNNNLEKKISLGFHSHNNQQLSYALAMQFVESVPELNGRECIVDSSLCGMGRGAGNAPTELIAGYLNRQYNTNYDINIIMDAIDMYMGQFMEKYKWGYSIPHMIAGTYSCHVNNVAYLVQTHRTPSKDMKIIFEMLDADARTHYDYDNLERVYTEYQNRKIDDSENQKKLRCDLEGRSLAIILPGKSSESCRQSIESYIMDHKTKVIGINAIVQGYVYDYLFFSNKVKYEFAKEAYSEQFSQAVKIVTSNIATENSEKQIIVNYNELLERKWKYYDNSMIMFLRLMIKVMPDTIGIAGFDGFAGTETKYADELLEPHISKEEIDRIQTELGEMYREFVQTNGERIKMEFITPSIFAKI